MGHRFNRHSIFSKWATLSAFLFSLGFSAIPFAAASLKCPQLLEETYYSLMGRTIERSLSDISEALPDSTKPRTAPFFDRVLGSLFGLRPEFQVAKNPRSLTHPEKMLLKDYLSSRECAKNNLVFFGVDRPLAQKDRSDFVAKASRLLESEAIAHKIGSLPHLDQEAIFILPKSNGGYLNRLAADVEKDGYRIGYSPRAESRAFFCEEDRFLSLPINSIFSPSADNPILAHELVHLINHHARMNGKGGALLGKTESLQGKLPEYAGIRNSGYESYFSHDELEANRIQNQKTYEDILSLDSESIIYGAVIEDFAENLERSLNQSLWLQEHMKDVIERSRVGHFSLKTIERQIYFEFRSTYLTLIPVSLTENKIRAMTTEAIRRKYYEALETTQRDAKESFWKTRELVIQAKPILSRSRDGMRVLRMVLLTD